MSDLLDAGAARGLNPAVWPRGEAAHARLLHVEPDTGALRDHHCDDLPMLLRPGDLVVVNDAGTFPASLPAWSAKGWLEIRLAGPPEDDAATALGPAVLFGAGSWKERTEDRRPPPRLAVGDHLVLGRTLVPGRTPPSDARPVAGASASEPGELTAEIVRVSPTSPRLVDLRFDRGGARLWTALYRLGRPVQYSHLVGALGLWDVNTPFGGRPWAVEMPSAGRPLTAAVLRDLRGRGLALASLSHTAGLSSTGDPVLDAHLPLPERSFIPEETVEAIVRARATGGRVVAVGTTVVRALEGRAAEPVGLRAGEGVARLRLGPSHRPRVVGGILSGLHEPGESHFELLRAFAPKAILTAALGHARRAGYLGHEFGDLCLILPVG